MASSDPTDDLQRNLSEVARALFAPGSVEGSLELVVKLAVATVDACDAAGVFVVRDERIVTAASSDPVVDQLDRLQLEHDEGPCLDAVSEGGSSCADDLAVDPRWPRFGPAAAAIGIHSALAFRLSEEHTSALNLYARTPAAFRASDQATGVIFATLAGIALDAATARAADEQRVVNLHEALLTRELIGQAQGILIEREHITAEEAFDVLRRASQHLNVKVREVATTLVQTGERPATGPRPASS